MKQEEVQQGETEVEDESEITTDRNTESERGKVREAEGISMDSDQKEKELSQEVLKEESGAAGSLGENSSSTFEREKGKEELCEGNA